MGVPSILPIKITELPEYTGLDPRGYVPYAFEGRTYKVQFQWLMTVNLSNDTPLSGGVAAPGTAVMASRSDHVHPAVDLGDPTETTGVLPPASGGIGTSALTGYVQGHGSAPMTAAPTVPVTDVSGGQAITGVNDTNVTLTLGGTPATAVLTATSFTLGWTGILSVARGGTGAGTLTGYVKGNGTSAMTASATVPVTDVSGGQAITGVNDTNVTLTLGGTPATAVLAATSLTLGWTGTLAPVRGGTGLASYAVGDLIVATASATLASLADVATGNALISGGVGVAPTYGKIGLTTHVTGVLPPANGGTGAGAFTQGSVVFIGASGTYAQDNVNFFWDGTNKRLGLGTAAPSSLLHLKSNANAGAGILLEQTASSSPIILFRANGNASDRDWRIGESLYAYGDFCIQCASTPGGTVDTTILRLQSDSIVAMKTMFAAAGFDCASSPADHKMYAHGIADMYAYDGGYVCNYGMATGQTFTSMGGNAGTAIGGYGGIVFHTVSSERMRITTAGNVGIGTSAPAFPLDVVGPSATSEAARIRAGAVGTGNFSQLLFEVGNSYNGTSQASILGVSTNSGNSDIALAFGTSTGTASAAVERMRIAADGKVTIAPQLYTPSYNFTVFGNAQANNFLTIPSDNANVATAVSGFNVPYSGDNLTFGRTGPSYSTLFGWCGPSQNFIYSAGEFRIGSSATNGYVGMASGNLVVRGFATIGTPTQIGTSALTTAGGALYCTGTGNSINIQMRNSASDGVFMLGAAAGATPDLLFLNNGGFETGRMLGAGGLLPGSDNAFDLGSAAKRWRVVWAGTGSINTSDAREKTVRGGLTTQEVKVARILCDHICAFQWNEMITEVGAANALMHIGLVAQDAFQVFTDNGLDWNKYAMCNHDTWDQIVEMRGDEQVEVQAAGDRYGIRADQFAFFMLGNVGKMLTAAEDQITTLEARIAALEAKIGGV